ncbi:MAG TPA: HPr family phosphocarrier protein [Lacipirellulaceae bacterium]|nr:HPr family phosphocarrier protein [Lacipirellulaceae bacterium]
MQTPRVTRAIVIRNAQGLHARPADMFARLARQFQSRIELVREGRRVEASSIMDLLTLGAAQGTELILEAEGVDANEAVEALVKLVESGFPLEEAGEQQAN